MTEIKKERRRDPRTESTLPLKIFKRGLDVITQTCNISSSGAYCRTTTPLPLMSKVGITLLLPLHLGKRVCTKKVECNGVVVRSEPAIIQDAEAACQSVAVFFTDLSKKDKNTISQYVLQSFKEAVA